MSCRSIPGYIPPTSTNTFIESQLPQRLGNHRKQHRSSVSLDLSRRNPAPLRIRVFPPFLRQQPFPTKWPEWGQGTSPQLKRIQSPGGTNHFSFQCIPGLLEMKCMTSDLLPLLYWVVCIHLNTINANCNLQTDWKGRKRRKTENIICILIRHSSIGHSCALLVFFPVFRWIVFWQGLKDCVVKCVNGTNRGIKRFPCRSKLSGIRCKPRLAVSCGNMLDGKGKGCEGNNAKTFHNAWNISVNWGPLFSKFL